MTKRTIAVVTGSRAEYGLLRWVIQEIHEDPECFLQLFVTGSHVSHTFGLTVQEIEKDGFPITSRIPILEDADTPTAVSHAMGNALRGFGDVFTDFRPDIFVVLGDRFEIFAAVAAAATFKIPVAHIHGGENTYGAIDELFRHAITKMSHLHFPAIEAYRRRIVQMGESPDRVFCFGAPGLDILRRITLLEREELAEELNLPLGKKWGIVTFHPATLYAGSIQDAARALIEALAYFDEMFWIFTFPNADMGSTSVMRAIETYQNQNPNQVKVFCSLGQLRYTSLLSHAVVMVGNSSSGIIEAPSFALPVVNVGDRQRGRIRAKNVIDVPQYEAQSIKKAIEKALMHQFRIALKDEKNPYGDGGVSKRIFSILKTYPLSDGLIQKDFYDNKSESI